MKNQSNRAKGVVRQRTGDSATRRQGGKFQSGRDKVGGQCLHLGKAQGSCTGPLPWPGVGGTGLGRAPKDAGNSPTWPRAYTYRYEVVSDTRAGEPATLHPAVSGQVVWGLEMGLGSSRRGRDDRASRVAFLLRRCGGPRVRALRGGSALCLVSVPQECPGDACAARVQRHMKNPRARGGEPVRYREDSAQEAHAGATRPRKPVWRRSRPVSVSHRPSGRAR